MLTDAHKPNTGVHVLAVTPNFEYPQMDYSALDELGAQISDLNGIKSFSRIQVFYNKQGISADSISWHLEDIELRATTTPLRVVPDLLYERGAEMRVNAASVRTRMVRSGICGNYVIGYPSVCQLEGLICKWHGLDRSQAPNAWAFAVLRFLLLMVIHPFEDGNGRAARAILDAEVARRSQTPPQGLTLSPFIHARMSDLVQSTVESHRVRTNRPLFEWASIVLTDRIAYQAWAAEGGDS